MKDTRLLKTFNDTKDVLCRYDYYIHTEKRILHLTNTELKIPHLMGLQYVGRPNQYAGDFGVYAVKKGRVTLESLEKLVRKYYRTKEKQDRMLKLIHLKLNVKFGEYHTLDMLSDTEQLMKKCHDKREEALVKDFISLWRKSELTASKPLV